MENGTKFSARKVICCSGNAGTAEIAENIALDVNDFKAIGDFTIQHDVDLLVVGPEQPLVDGIHDYFSSQPDWLTLP